MKTIEIKGKIYQVGISDDTYSTCEKCCLYDACNFDNVNHCHDLSEYECLERVVGPAKPTDEQVAKVLDIFFSDKVDAECVNAFTDIETVVEQILEHWEDGDSSLEHL